MSPSGKVGILCWLPAVVLITLLTACSTAHLQRPGDWANPNLYQPSPALTEVQEPESTSPIVLGPAPVSTEWFDNQWVPLKKWCAANGLPPATRLNGDAYSGQAVQTGSGNLVLTPGTRVARGAGIDVHLGHPPRLSDGDLLVHGVDLRKTVEPLLLTGKAPILDKTRPVVIDPGHGGEDSGARSPYTGLLEKELTLDWARHVASLLAASGWPVVLTRTNDTDLALSNRVSIADSVDASVFISLHFNSGISGQGRGGVETYCLTPAGLPSTETRGYAEQPAVRWPNNNHDLENILLACNVQRELLTIPGVRDRGVRRARFMSVLRTQSRPAILVEGGYLSDPAEARMIADPAHRQRLAQAIVRALIGGELLVGKR